MPATLRHTLLSVRDLLATVGPFVVLAIALLALAYWVLDPAPPKRVVLATGDAQGAYAEFGKRYVQALKEYGIQVELRSTQGAAENLKLLEDPASGVDIAFVLPGSRFSRSSRLHSMIVPPRIAPGPSTQSVSGLSTKRVFWRIAVRTRNRPNSNRPAPRIAASHLLTSSASSGAPHSRTPAAARI